MTANLHPILLPPQHWTLLSCRHSECHVQGSGSRLIVAADSCWVHLGGCIPHLLLAASFWANIVSDPGQINFSTRQRPAMRSTGPQRIPVKVVSSCVLSMSCKHSKHQPGRTTLATRVSGSCRLKVVAAARHDAETSAVAIRMKTFELLPALITQHVSCRRSSKAKKLGTGNKRKCEEESSIKNQTLGVARPRTSRNVRSGPSEPLLR